MAASLTSRVFGFLPGGECVQAWTLTGKAGLVLEVIAYGGAVTRLLAPCREGRLADVVLGFADLASYQASHACCGAIVGRVAGRVTGAHFSLAGTEYALTANDGPNHLHGGTHGFHRRVWAGAPVEKSDGSVSLRLTHTSTAGDEGYPGTVTVAVIYTVTSNNVFVIETEAVSDHATPFSLTHHSYFNLAGVSSRSIAGHELQIFSDCVVATDSDMTLLNRLEPVTEANDFRTARTLRMAIPGLFKNHGDLYRLGAVDGASKPEFPVPAARLTDPESGRVLDVSTTEEYLQLYTGSSLAEPFPGKHGEPYAQHAGLCLECEGYPNGANAPQLGDVVLQPGIPRRTVTEYAFSTINEKTETSVPGIGHELRYAPATPRKKDFRIGVLGSGFIVRDCHLVSYRQMGFNPVAIASRTAQNAAAVAREHGIATAYGTYEELLDDPTIEVLDIAVPPTYQLDLIRAACERGTVKGILAQKPLALNYSEAMMAVRCCSEAGITLAVNQNMRFDPSVYAAKALLDADALGTPVFATIDMRAVPHWQPWQAETGCATLRIMSVHHLDCMRYWFGDPAYVFCSTRPDPRTQFPHSDGICTTLLEYENGLRCVILDDVWTGPVKEGCPGDVRIEWRIEGLDGLAIGDVGWCKDPYTTPSTMRYARKGDPDFRHFRPRESWFPDAFGATMGHLLVSLESGARCAIDGQDNLRTMALVEAAVLSAAERRAVSPVEITSAYNEEA